MFERFTESARQLVVEAQRLAGDVNDNHIGTEHLLLAALDATEPVDGLDVDQVRSAIGELRSPKGRIDQESLAGLGIDLDAVRERVEQTFGAGALDRPAATPGRRRFWQRRGAEGGWIQFTADAKAALERSLREVVDAGAREIGADAILVALLHPSSGIAHRAVVRSGTDPGTVAARLRDRLRPAA
ncbi:Clp protease [Enemella evansiae]|uniref:Clp protease N-terminal domain-containing protein n=1 Tax=Enemella evansiae TaxID=2016499 RepID=UPI000B96FD13|nr:Clp protease N-terminal domain-containing protein [Enemella evansiae]OYO17021.1 Clp protease [Enemella evansiae]